MDHHAFVRANTSIVSAPLVPEFRLHLATEITPLWQATEDSLAANQLAPPYWAFAWAGGQAVARFILDHPNVVKGLRLLDFAAGGGLIALAVAKAGALTVEAIEIDPLAAAALEINAALNNVTISASCKDVIGDPLKDVDVVVTGDVCYEREMSQRIITWLTTLARAGKSVYLGDPGRTYLPTTGLEALASYDVPTTLELEDRLVRRTTVWCLTG